MSEKIKKIAALVPEAEKEYAALLVRMKNLRDRWQKLHDDIGPKLAEIRKLEEEMDQVKPLIQTIEKLVPEEKRK